MAKIDRESYFDLPVSDQADVLQSLAPVMGRRAETKRTPTFILPFPPPLSYNLIVVFRYSEVLLMTRARQELISLSDTPLHKKGHPLSV